jgi:hypothetical protein
VTPDKGESPALAPKAIPPAKGVKGLLRLRPPQAPGKDHEYFARAGAVALAPEERGFSWATAWWLAEMALLAYVRDPHDVETQLSRAGFEAVRCFGFERRASTECFAAEREGVLVVAFRGSEARERIDWTTNMDARLVALPEGGAVHAGFLRALERGDSWDRLARHVRERQRSRTLVLTGHSLGGALATLAAARLGGGARLYTFGAPKVGDRRFAAGPAREGFRIVHARDPVPRLPPLPRYAHAGALHAIGRGASLGPLADHLPLIYALRVWNALVASLS